MKKIPTNVMLTSILNQLAECHVLGKDSLKYGNALAALEQVIREDFKQEVPNESDVQ